MNTSFKLQYVIMIAGILLTSCTLDKSKKDDGSELSELKNSYKNYFVNVNSNKSVVKIHYIEKGDIVEGKTSLLYSLGLWESAERAISLFDGLDHHAISFSYRGRGLSDTPEKGYDLEDHLTDMEAVVDESKIDQFCLLAFSRGIGSALAYALKHPEKIKGLIIVDQGPVHVKPGEGYAEFWKNLVYLGKPITDFMRPEALDALEREARHVNFEDHSLRLMFRS